MILIIDNYDSFTYNLYQYVGEIYQDVKVIRNNQFTIDELKNMNLKGIIISPGPGRPENAGLSIDVIKEFTGVLPILGICLGHQAIGYSCGGKIIAAPEIMHGKTSMINHNDKDIFKGMKNPLKVMRYHSLIIDNNMFPNELEITAETDDGIVMAIKHKKYEVYGVQFHPESIFTDEGKIIIKNFVGGICNDKRSN